MTEQIPNFGAPRTTIEPLEGDPDLADLNVPIDPELEDPATELEAIAAELAGDVEDETTVPIAVHGRRGNWAVVCNTTFDLKDVELLKKKSVDRAFKSRENPLGVNPGKLGALLIGTQCVAITRGGKEIRLDGKTATFATPAFQRLVNGGATPGVAATVKKVFGLESRVVAASDVLMEAAGWGDDGERADPTL